MKTEKSAGDGKAYKVVSISLYHKDIERLESMVETLKNKGYTRANKSRLIRFALDKLDIDDMPSEF